eukprot:Skav208268  [mRNA]  locus=scaffold188:298459:299357:- [translate_table: standard]
MVLLFAQDRYADHICGKGTYLGLADIALWSVSKGKSPWILFWDDENVDGEPATRPLIEVLNQLVEGTVPELEMPEKVTIESPDAWVVAACRADYSRGPFMKLNHYVPAFPRSQLGDDWQKEVDSIQDPGNPATKDKVKKRVQSCRTVLSDMDDDSDNEFKESAKNHLCFWEGKAGFLQKLVQMGLLVGEVPCEGNCAVWTIDALSHGSFIRNRKTSMESAHRIRQDMVLRVHWMSKP